MTERWKVGDEVVWLSFDEGTINRGTITKLRTSPIEELAWVNNCHRPEECIYQAYLWPARLQEQVIAIRDERARLQKAYDDSMGLWYKLRNAWLRGEV